MIIKPKHNETDNEFFVPYVSIHNFLKQFDNNRM